ncbi:MAG: ATP-binding protein, partial [Myxococcales bacterium]|nr:ATP-binding protein [Myxococcales bacterium]
EVVANAVDEVLAGRCSRIDVTIEADGAVTVEDDGGGMRTDIVDGMAFPELAFTTLHHTATLDGHAPHEHVGLHGVGLCAVSALSQYVTFETWRDGSRFRQRFERGRPVSKLERVGATELTGTRVTFRPDADIFSLTLFDAERIRKRLEEFAYLLPELTLTLKDRRELQFHHPRGLVAWVEAQLRDDPDVATSRPFYLCEEHEDVIVEVAANWGSQSRSAIESFANINRTTSGGAHVRGLLLGLVAGVRAATPLACKGRRTVDLERAVSRGLVAIVCVRLNDPEFDGPTRSELSTPRVRKIVKKMVENSSRFYLHGEPELLRRITSGANRVRD